MSGRATLPWPTPLPPVEEAPPLTDHPIVAAPPTRQDSATQKGGRLWLRNWKLSIGDAPGGNALDLSELSFEFHVEQGLYLEPWAAVIKIYNIADDVITRMQQELTFVNLDAGYRNSTQYGKVFGGPIAYYKFGRLNATDTFVEIHAAQNDRPLTAAYVNNWLPAGHTQEDIVKALAAAGGVDVGQITTTLNDYQSARGRAMYGMVRDALRDLAATIDGKVWIDGNAKLHVLGKDEYLAMGTESVPVLNSKSGLIDIPTQELGAGISFKCLLNPKIVPGGQIRVAQKDITQYQDVNSGSFVQTNFDLGNSREDIKADGYYMAVKVLHSGANRGNEWYTEVISEPINTQKAPPTLSSSI